LVIVEARTIWRFSFRRMESEVVTTRDNGVSVQFGN